MTWVDELAVFLDAHLPAFLDTEPEPTSFAARRRWQAILASGGWVGLGWPGGDGGRGLGIRDRLACDELLYGRRAPMIAGVLGVNNVGPTISAWGTAEQRGHLAPILTGAEIWAQGFSEPDAGSDLASLRSRGRPVPGGFRLDGHKVWTSNALAADWCQVLARTGGEATGRRGITCFLVDLRSPGVTVRPLRQATGDDEFGEIVLDDVFVPNGCVLGPPGDGWSVAMSTLSFERANVIGLGSQLREQVLRLVREARLAPLPSAQRLELVGCYVDAELLRYLACRSLEGADAGLPPGPEHTALKLLWSQMRQRVALLACSLQGPGGQAWESDDDHRREVGWELVRSRASTIAAGTTEVVLSVLAERVLGLPRG